MNESVEWMPRSRGTRRRKKKKTYILRKGLRLFRRYSDRCATPRGDHIFSGGESARTF